MVIRAFELVHHKPNSPLDVLDITVDANNIILCFFRILVEKKSVKYQQEGDNCNLVYNDAKSTLQNSNFVSVFCEDLSEILLEQNLAGTSFWIYTARDYDSPDFISSQILNTIKTSLSLRSVKMDFDILHLKIFGFEQVMDLLSYINPKLLERLELSFPAFDAQEDIEQVLASERWIAFKNLDFVLHWHTVSTKEMMFIKKILTTSRIFKSIIIHFKQLDKEKVKEIFGQRINVMPTRYLRVPNTKNQVLSTYVSSENNITFSRKQDKYTYDFLATDEDFIPFEDCSDWSKTLENKTIIELLLDHLGFIEIQTLRKVCSNIRTCIDHYKPDPNLTKLGIILHELRVGRIDIKMGFMDGSYWETPYAKPWGLWSEMKSGCTVDGIFLVNQDVNETCLNDLKTIVPRKEFRLEEFEFSVCTRGFSRTPELLAKQNEFLEKLEKLLSPNNVLLKVRKFIFFAYYVESYQMPKPILWLEPISLELIEIHSDNNICDAEMNEVMKLIMNTNQWQYAKEFMMKGFVFLGKVGPIHFVHFSKIDIIVKNWTNEDFFNWQEEILYSPSFLRYKISFENCSIDNDIYNLLGLPFRTVNGRTTWYFKMPEKNLVLHINYYTSKHVIFTRVDIEDVPEVVVMNFDVQLID